MKSNYVYIKIIFYYHILVNNTLFHVWSTVRVIYYRYLVKTYSKYRFFKKTKSSIVFIFKFYPKKDIPYFFL